MPASAKGPCSATGQPKATYRQPDLQAAVELYVAARTDADLAAALARIEPAHRANLQRISGWVIDPSLVALPGFASFVELALAAVFICHATGMADAILLLACPRSCS